MFVIKMKRGNTVKFFLVVVSLLAPVEDLQILSCGLVKKIVPKWLEEFAWLEYRLDENKMHCSLCRKSKKNNTFTEGCQNFTRKTVEYHVGRLDDVHAVEADLNSTIRPLSTAAVRILQQNEEATIAAMRCVYWLAKTENPTHTFVTILKNFLLGLMPLTARITLLRKCNLQ